MSEATPTTVVCYDGVCGLCNGFVVFLLRRDSGQRLRFAALQGATAQQLLAVHAIVPSDLNTIYVIADWRAPSERALARSAAVLHALRQLDRPWPVVARLGSLVPRPVADHVYRAIARIRYRIFGKYDRCPVPPPGWQRAFLDQ